MNLALASIAVLILGTAVVAMSLRKLVHTAILLVVTWFGLAVFYLWAGAEFVAFAQILIYAGAISMVVLFAVLLTRPISDFPPANQAGFQRGLAALVVGLAAAVAMGYAILRTPFTLPATPAPTVTVRDLGHRLMEPHIAAVLIVALILTAALIGAVVIASSPKTGDDAS